MKTLILIIALVTVGCRTGLTKAASPSHFNHSRGGPSVQWHKKNGVNWMTIGPRKDLNIQLTR